MRLRVGEDEIMTYYLSPVEDRLGGPVIVELAARDYADYRRVQLEHESWQRRLAELKSQREASK